MILRRNSISVTWNTVIPTHDKLYAYVQNGQIRKPVKATVNASSVNLTIPIISSGKYNIEIVYINGGFYHRKVSREAIEITEDIKEATSKTITI